MGTIKETLFEVSLNFFSKTTMDASLASLLMLNQYILYPHISNQTGACLALEQGILVEPYQDDPSQLVNFLESNTDEISSQTRFHLFNNNTASTDQFDFQ